MVLTAQGEELWLDAVEVTGTGEPTLVTFFLPFTGGDLVGWQVMGRRLGVEVIYRVRLVGTPFGEDIEADAGGPELRTG